jgi:hypothetical protein
MARCEDLVHDPKERVFPMQESLTLRERTPGLFVHRDKTRHGPPALENGDGLLTVGDPADEL